MKPIIRLQLIAFLCILQAGTALVSFAQQTERIARIDSFMQRYIDGGRLNGATGIIIHKGQVICHKAWGTSSREKKLPMQKDAIFRIASMTKPVISVAVMMLWEEGKFSLEDPVSKFIPTFKDPQVLDRFFPADTTYTTIPAKGQITIRQLLNHTSGIGYAQIGSHFANAIYAKHKINGGIGTTGSTLSNVIPRLGALPIFHNPGEKFLYGLNTDVLGYLVEVVSGMTLDKFLQQRIFGPLGMKDTYFYLPKEKQERLVPMYRQEENGKLATHDGFKGALDDKDFPLKNGTYLSGGAGLSSTAYDYALFCQMLLNGGVLNNVRLLSPHTIRLMTINQIGNYDMWDKDLRRFGLGFGLYLEKASTILPVGEGTFEWDGMYATHFWVDPKNQLVVVFMRNIWPSQDWDFKDRLKPLVYGALF